MQALGADSGRLLHPPNHRVGQPHFGASDPAEPVEVQFPKEWLHLEALLLGQRTDPAGQGFPGDRMNTGSIRVRRFCAVFLAVLTTRILRQAHPAESWLLSGPLMWVTEECLRLRKLIPAGHPLGGMQVLFE